MNSYQMYGNVVEKILERDLSVTELITQQEIMDILSLLGFYITCCGGNIKSLPASLKSLL